jgi:FkbM family methyltransferase
MPLLTPRVSGLLKFLCDTVLQPFGLQLRRRFGQVDRLDVFFDNWRRLGPTPKFIIDIGANRGEWTRKSLLFFPDAKYVLIEPQNELRQYCNDILQLPQVHWLNAGASDRVGTMALTLTGADCSATFGMSEEAATAKGLQQVHVPVTTLDEVCAREKAFPDLVKIDAEGLDLDVLRGGVTLFGKTGVFLVECSVCARSLPNTLERVCDFMGSHKYRLFDITHLNVGPRNRLLWLVEAVFVHESSPAWDRLGTY